MSTEHAQVAGGLADSRDVRSLAIVAVLSTCLYGIIAVLSWQFDFDSSVTQRPIVSVLVLFAAAFAGYLFAIRVVARAPQDRRLLGLIVLSAAWMAAGTHSHSRICDDDTSVDHDGDFFRLRICHRQPR